MLDDQNSESQTWLPTAVLIALVPTAAYFYTYLYEYSFCSFFGIPSNLISISAPQIVSLGLALFLFGQLLLMLMGMLPIKASETHLASIWKQLPIPLGVVVLAIILPAPLVLKLLLIISALMVLAADFFSKKNLIYETIMLRLGRGLGHKTVIATVAINIGAIIASSGGWIYAKLQDEFPVLQTEPKQVILRRYGDDFITAYFQPSTHLVSREFSIIRLSDKEPLRVRIEHIGPLRSEARNNI